MDLNECKLLPDVHPFQYQVAGHKSSDVAGTSGILKHKDGYLLKPVKKSCDDVEIKFYERLIHSDELLPLRKFIPDFFGCLKLDVNGKDTKFLKLKDVTDQFEKPCVMDIKIGKQTWEPNASSEKRKCEEAKYIGTKKEFGFCIPGYYVHNISSGSLIKFGREQGKRLGRETTYEAFKEFFNFSSGHAGIILKNIIRQLQELLSWWNSQDIIHAYSSSILLVYDANKLEKLISEELKTDDTIHSSWIKVYTIDFAHVVDADKSKDLNYIDGLSNLIKVLESLI